MKLKVAGLVLAMGIILGLCVVFLPTSSEVEAGLDVSTSVLNDVNRDIGAKGYQVKETLLSQDTTLAATNKAKEELDPFIQEQQAELERLLQEYYDSKLNNLLTESELELLKQKIVTIRDNIYNRYKGDIDNMFK